jgi:RNA polymerase sigma-70 factor (ECF subfamily)
VADERDRQLVRHCLDGQRDAATQLVDRYQRRLFTVAYRMLGNEQDAEDVVQSVFGNAFAALATYDPRFRFFSWMYRMTVNESLNTLKRRRPMVSLDGTADLPAPAADLDAVRDAERRVDRALRGLKPDDRAIVVLKHFVSLSYDDIAEVLDVPVKTVKSRLFTARERLRVVLLAEGNA